MASLTFKRPADVAYPDAAAAHLPKRARFESADISTEETNGSHGTTPRSPASVPWTDDVSIAHTSVTSRSTSRRPKKYVCEYDGCDKAFDRPVRLQAHIRTHTNDRPFICDEEGCDKSFFKLEHLKAHIQNKHSNEVNHICTYIVHVNENGEQSECGKAFTTSTRLRRHLAIHEKAEELTCQEIGCGQVFRKMETLQRHIKKDHLKEKAFRCSKLVSDGSDSMEEVCGQEFSTVGQLKAHEVRQHSGMRHFCSTCPPSDAESGQLVGFETYAEYQAHLKLVHSPTCTICDRRCDTNRALAAHMEIEHSSLSTRKANFKCEYPGCDRSFTRQGNLNVHIQSVHVRRKKFICGEFDLAGNDKCPGWSSAIGCGATFTTKASLEAHVRTQHLDLPDLYHARKSAKVKVKKEANHKSTTSPRTLHTDFDEMMELDDDLLRTTVGTSLGLLTGHGYEQTRPHACWSYGCPVRFTREYDLSQHMELVHGWNVDDIDDHMREKEALEGGQFWIGGAAQLYSSGGLQDSALFDFHAHDGQFGAFDAGETDKEMEEIEEDEGLNEEDTLFASMQDDALPLDPVLATL